MVVYFPLFKKILLVVFNLQNLGDDFYSIEFYNLIFIQYKYTTKKRMVHLNP